MLVVADPADAASANSGPLRAWPLAQTGDDSARCSICLCPDDAVQYEHAGRAIAHLSDAERGVLSYLATHHAGSSLGRVLSSALAMALVDPRASVVHAYEELIATPKDDVADAVYLAEVLVGGGF